MSYILDALRKADAQRERDPARGIHAQPGRASMDDSPPGAGLRAGFWIAGAAGLVALAVAGWYVYRDPAPRMTDARVASAPAPQARVSAPPPAAPTVAAPVLPAAVVPAPVVLPPPVVPAPTVATRSPPATPPSRIERPGMPPPMPGQVGVGATARAMAQANQAMPAPAQSAQQSPQVPSQTTSQAPAAVPIQPTTQPSAATPTAPPLSGGVGAPAQPGVPAAQVATPQQPPPAVPSAVAPPPPPAPYVPPIVVPPSPPPAPVAGLPPDAPKIVITGGVYTTNKAQRMLIVNGQVMTEGADLGSGVTLEEIRPKSAVLRFRGGRYAVTY